MIVVASVAGALVGLGVWALWRALFPPPEPLPTLAARLAEPRNHGAGQGATSLAGAWLWVRRRAARDDLAADLAVCDRAPARHALDKLGAAVALAVMPVLFAGVAAAGGGAVPSAPLLVVASAALSVGGWYLADLLVRSEARRRRRDFKRLAGGVAVYDHQDLVPLDDPHHAAIADYVAAVLSAVDVRWGPAHTEVIATARGPLLVEVSARLAGSISPSASVLATGQNQIVSTVRALVDHTGFLRDTPARLPLRRRCRGVSLICDRAGVVTEDLDWERFRSLASFHGLRARVRAGDHLSVTGELLSRPGGVYLVHDDPEVLDADLARIRAWEAGDLYRLVAPAGEPVPSRVASSVP